MFGIIKQVMGFREFLLHGLEKVSGEWSLVYLSYNLKRMRKLIAAMQGVRGGSALKSCDE